MMFKRLIIMLALFPVMLQAQDHVGHNMNTMPSFSGHEVIPAFELTGHDGRLVTLEDFSGKHVLITFGFTQCAHICPMIAANMARVLRNKKNTAGIFISVDTERDSAEITHRYATGFHENMLGLSGTYEKLNQAADNFKVSYSVSKTQRNYTVQHTTNIFLIGPDGKMIDIFAMNTPVETITSHIKK